MKPRCLPCGEELGHQVLSFWKCDKCDRRYIVTFYQHRKGYKIKQVGVKGSSKAVEWC